MGVLQKAYAFVKKHWSTDDDVFPDDLNRYEDGIEDLYSRATEQSKQINVLSTTHGYVNSNSMGDFNVCVKNGKYIVYFNGDGVEQHAPPNIVTGDNTFAVDVTQQSDTVLVQEICGIYGPNQGRKFYRVNTFGSWTDWKEISTTSKTDILITYNQDYEPIDTNLNKIVKNSLGEVIIYFSVKRKDGGIFSGNNLFVVGAIPVGTRPISDMGFCVLGYETGVSNFKPVGVSVYANGSVVIQTDSQVTAITGVIKYEAVR